MPDTTDNAKLVEETVNIFAPAEAKRALDELRAALASAPQLWQCPDCAFSFDAMHADEGGGYSCPACAETRLTAALASANALNERLVAELEAATGYLLNARIDLETGATKKTAIQTIEGGLKRIRALLADMGKGDGGWGMTNEEIVAHQRRAREFAETEVGKAFLRFENAHLRYWQQDSNDHISDRRLRELDEAANKARAALVALLRPLAGLEP